MNGETGKLFRATESAALAEGETAALRTLLAGWDVLAAYLETAAEGGPNAGLLLGRTYLHDNGFLKTVLWRGASEMKCVLHVWPARDQPVEDNIHNHRWDFSSAVLCGGLNFERYSFNSEGVPYPALSYESPGNGRSYRADRLGQVTVARDSFYQLSSGTRYDFAHHLLHRAWGVPGVLTATVVVQQPFAQRRTLVLPRGEQAIGSSIALRRPDHEWFRRILRQVLFSTSSRLTPTSRT